MIEFKNIHLSFNGKSVIKDFSLKINTGEKIVISGKSGCGKSSLLALVLGFVQPSSGQIYFEDKLLDENSVWTVRKRISYIDQSVSLGSGKVQRLFSDISNLKANSALDLNTDELLTHFDLCKDLLFKDIQELSGGEKQRMAIIIAILLNRDVFFLDEVTASLDTHLKERVADYFLNRTDSTCLIVSHDPVWQNNKLVRVFNFEEKKWKH